MKTIEIVVNDQPMTVDAGTTIEQLLERLKIHSPAIAVEVNEVLRPRNDFATTKLEPGDCLEIVTLVGGG